ncbi:MAG: galactokinase family protein [Sediminicola sp.]
METDTINLQGTITSIAPGRTCLFGDHQDYLSLPVIACAIDRYVTLEAVPNNLNVFRLDMADIGEVRVIGVGEAFPNLAPRDYFASSLRVLGRYGCIPDRGYDITVRGNIPINSGTSSSSALLLAWINFLIRAFGIRGEVGPELLSVLGHASEVVEHGEPGGMMDHFSIGVGNIVHITTSKPYSFKVIGTRLDGLITGVSGVPKETVGLLSRVKGSALAALDTVSTNFSDFDLHTATLDDMRRFKSCLKADATPYFEAAIKNHHYTGEALKEFEGGDPDPLRLGELMNDHHAVLRDLLKITVPRIDKMVDAALYAGAYGAKIVGSGGGGSIVVLAPPKAREQVCEALMGAGAKEAYGVNVDKGARIIN